MSYWGNHTSLYSTLPAEEVQGLEKAIRFQVRGEYAESLKSFALLNESISWLPVVLIERAILFERMGLVQEQLKLLNAVVYPSAISRPKAGTDEWDLLGQLRAQADLYANGTLESALWVACIVATRLKQKECIHFSDLEVSAAGSQPPL